MREKRNQYALMDDPIMDEPADLHVRGTIPRGNGKLEFWMSAPRPKGMSQDQWDKIRQARWDLAFPKSKKKKEE